MKVYKYAKGWAIFIYIITFLLALLFTGLLLMPVIPGMEDESGKSGYWFIALLSLGMLSFCIIAIIDTYKGKFVIDNEKIYSIGVFSQKQLLFNEIKGYRMGKNEILIFPLSNEKKKIKVSIHYEKSDEIIEWLKNNYPDVDKIIFEEEQKEILESEEFGSTTVERAVKLKKARRVSKAVNTIGAITGLWVLFYPYPYEYVIHLCIFIPIICLITSKLSGDLIHFTTKTGSAYPSIFVAALISSIAVCVRAIFDFTIFEYKNVWSPSILIALAFVGILLTKTKEFKFKTPKEYLSIVGIFILSFCFSYGAVVTTNCLYDDSVPELFTAQIISKRVSRGKTTTYYFTLSPWGKQTEADEVDVPKELYDLLNEKELVSIYLKKGKFDIPWFVISQGITIQ